MGGSGATEIIMKSRIREPQKGFSGTTQPWPVYSDLLAKYHLAQAESPSPRQGW